MKCVDFYRGKPNHAGHTLGDVWGFRPGEYEMDHDYIQFMFPSNEPSMMNCDAPVLTLEECKIFKADPELREKLKYSFIKILGFFGFRLIESAGPPSVEEEPGVTGTEHRRWMNHFNHNFLRVTRILKSLRLCGLDEYAIAFYNCLRQYKHQSGMSVNSMEHWRKAAQEDLWQ
jgi:hypothetical protein